MAYILLNDQFLPAEAAMVSPEERGFRFGDGVFETIRVESRVPYQWVWHMARLNAGLAALRIPYASVTLQPLCRELLLRNGAMDGILRIYVSRGRGSKGYLPAVQGEPCLLAEFMPLPAVPQQAVEVCVSGYEKISPRALPPVKHAQGLNAALARMEAMERGCFEALQVNWLGKLCEGSSSSLFWYAGGALFTPSLTTGAIAGSTRAALFRLSPWPVTEGEFPVDILASAEAVLLTNVSWEILPVARVKPYSWAWKSEKIAATLREALSADRRREAQAQKGLWTG